MTPEDVRKRRAEDIAEQKRINEAYQADQDKRSLAAAIAYDETKPSIEKRRRAQAAANTPEAWAKRNDWDPFMGD
jgi:hypothetical protein